MTRRNQQFQTIRSEGGLLPPDLLQRVVVQGSNLDGMRPEDYGLPAGARLNEMMPKSWSLLSKHWAEFRTRRKALLEESSGTGLTNERWNLPLLRELGFGWLPASAGPEIDGRTFAINRFFGPVPVHLIGCGLPLDRRTAGQRGAAAANPHGLVQEFLNRSDAHLWAIVSNGLCLRILHDSRAISRQSFLEFDLKAMFDGEVYPDFVLLWLVAHASRFAPMEEDNPASCRLEQWAQEADKQGTRVLGELREGVKKALETLGTGFISHPKNVRLQENLRSGQLTTDELHEQLLRVVYRLIFLFVAEDRTIAGVSLLHPPDNTESGHDARGRYATYYSTARMREMAGHIKGSRHADLWRQLRLLVRALSGEERGALIRRQLALPALGSFLWAPGATTALNNCELTNYDLLEAIRHLSFTRKNKVLRPVNYKDLGAEELGGVYEGLLELRLKVSGNGARISFEKLAGNRRQSSGSYYTPDSLVQCLLDSALEPVIKVTIEGKNPSEAEQAILGMKICDPAVGSGHFLIGAAHRLAAHLARTRSQAENEGEPSPLLYQQALRDVIGHCLYGVDVNPMAAELCRVGLWLEALEPGKPLSFLEQHIQVGNSLLGATPALIEAGLPDDAFKPIEGDDGRICSELRRRNRVERSGQIAHALPMVAEDRAEYNTLAARSQSINTAPDASLAEVQAMEVQYKRLIVSPDYRHQQRIADAWCAAFVWPKTKDSYTTSITTATLRNLEENADTPIPVQQLEQISTQYQFFHWHLAFPEVFEQGGFDCILGNPPWERLKLQEKEWFRDRNQEIADAPNAAARGRLIANLIDKDPHLYSAWLSDKRKASGESHILRHSGRYPLCGRGDINLYTVFAEVMRTLLQKTGRAGCVVPFGIATDDTTKMFFRDLIEKQSLVSLFDFENKGIFFPDVHSSYKFCLLTTGSGIIPTVQSAEFVFFAHKIDELRDPNRCVALSPEDIMLMNPNTRTCPIFRSSKDAELTKAIYRRVPVLIRERQGNKPEENPWKIRFKRMFDMANDAGLFRTREQLEDEGWELDGNVFRKDGESCLLLYEAKMIHHYDHRWASRTESKFRRTLFTERQNPDFVVLGRYWVPETDMQTALSNINWDRKWLMGWRDITNITNERTTIASIIPRVAVGHSLSLMFPLMDRIPHQLLLACLNSFVCDFSARQKIGGMHLTLFIMQQIPVLHPKQMTGSPVWDKNTTIEMWLVSRVLEMVFTNHELVHFSEDCGWDGPPFRWDEDRRFMIRCELDAAFFHLYLPADEQGNWHPVSKLDGYPYDETPEQLAELNRHLPTPRDAVAYIMDTFPIVCNKDQSTYGEYRTKRVILERYDALHKAARTGCVYQSPLNPLPGPPTDSAGHFVCFVDIAANPPPHLHRAAGYL